MAQDPRRNRTTGQGDFYDLTDAERRERKGLEFFGFELRRKPRPGQEEVEDAQLKSPVPPLEENESAYITAAGGFYGQVMDVRGDNFANDRDLIVKYRNAAMQPEVDQAIEDIVNEAIVANDSDFPISLDLENTDLSESAQEKVQEEFDYLLRMLDFRKYGHDIFRRWYIDGRLYYHVVIDLKNPKQGIRELRPINPLKIQKVKELVEKEDPRTGAKFVDSVEEYFVYSDDGFSQGTSVTQSNSTGETAKSGLKMPKDSVAHITSGILDNSRRSSLSYLHKALRNVNQLRMMEDALVIYRLARAPERRLFYIDTGDLPPAQAQKYMSSIIQKYRNKLTYNSETGEVTDTRKHMHMLEDFWLPRSSTGRGTDVSNLPGGQNLGEIEDIVYFQKKLYQALNVPINRLDPDTGYNLGRATEINRDEIRFQKFIDRLRIKFADLFKQILRVQLVLKGILKENEWEDAREFVIIDYARDNFFSELKEAEILRERIDTLNAVEPHVGVYFSKEYIRKEVLKMTEEQIEEIKHQIRSEALDNDALPDPDEAETGEGGGDEGFSGDLGGGGDDGDLDDFEDEEDFGEPEGAATELGPEDEEGEEELPDEDEEEL